MDSVDQSNVTVIIIGANANAGALVSWFLVNDVGQPAGDLLFQLIKQAS